MTIIFKFGGNLIWRFWAKTAKSAKFSSRQNFFPEGTIYTCCEIKHVSPGILNLITKANNFVKRKFYL